MKRQSESFDKYNPKHAASTTEPGQTQHHGQFKSHMETREGSFNSAASDDSGGSSSADSVVDSGFRFSAPGDPG
eukprot:CAMPEP_0113943036 /NCGR_PEP_ID=MMETSP1339-20121228/16964_1 /TAXON_ID=94617 /ORGANISM="Fibrocapsa japonica" /LENGTH=73 /DNA_ID=CAMNT_0000947771 /DNA_START=197 /DNA_END=418 /DNA_ORIENTATION=+ /assembly_acc=CAM_ASM_000762